MPKLLGFGQSSVPGVDDARDAYNSIDRVGIPGNNATKMDPGASHGAAWFTLSVLPFLSLETTLTGGSLMGTLTSQSHTADTVAISAAKEVPGGNGNALRVVNDALNLGYAVLFLPIPGSSGGYSYGFVFVNKKDLAYHIAATGDVGSSILVLGNPIIYGEPPVYRASLPKKSSSLFSFVDSTSATQPAAIQKDKMKWIGPVGILAGLTVMLLIMTNE